MNSRINALNAERRRAWDQAQGLLDHVASEHRDMSSEESAQFARMNTAISDLDDEIASIIERRDADAVADTLRAAHMSIFPEVTARGRELDTDAQLRAFLRGDFNGSMTVDLQRVARERDLVRQGASDAEIRALAWDASSGSLVVPTTFARTMYDTLEAAVAVLRMPVTKLTTTSGEDMYLPKVTTHSLAAQVTGQGSAFAGSDPVLNRTALPVYKYGQLCKVSSELIEDAAVDISSFLARDIGRALGRVLAADLVVGTGTGEPLGVMAGAAMAGAGSITTGGSLIAPTIEKYIDAQYLLTDEHRQNAGGACWLMKDSTAANVRKLRDGAGGTVGAFLWQPSTVAGQPDTFLGHRLYTDTNVAAAGSNARIAAFLDPEAYVVRQVGNPTIDVDRSVYFATDEVGVRGRLRAGGNLQTAGAITSIVQNV